MSGPQDCIGHMLASYSLLELLYLFVPSLKRQLLPQHQLCLRVTAKESRGTGVEQLWEQARLSVPVVGVVNRCHAVLIRFCSDQNAADKQPAVPYSQLMLLSQPCFIFTVEM